jgi:hypothetical protein
MFIFKEFVISNDAAQAPYSNTLPFSGSIDAPAHFLSQHGLNNPKADNLAQN